MIRWLRRPAPAADTQPAWVGQLVRAERDLEAARREERKAQDNKSAALGRLREAQRVKENWIEQAVRNAGSP